jgi:hypothetical protein
MEAVQTTARDFEGNGEVIEAAIRKCERSAGYKTRSFFVKRLEQHLLEKSVNVPSNIFDLFDTPFVEFTPEYSRVYEHKVKGQALFHIFSDMLLEIFESIDADRIGWEAAANYLEDTPMKVCALHTLTRIQQLEEMPDYESLDLAEELSVNTSSVVTPRAQKLYVKPYVGVGKGRRGKRHS